MDIDYAALAQALEARGLAGSKRKPKAPKVKKERHVLTTEEKLRGAAASAAGARMRRALVDQYNIEDEIRRAQVLDRLPRGRVKSNALNKEFGMKRMPRGLRKFEKNKQIEKGIASLPLVMAGYSRDIDRVDSLAKCLDALQFGRKVQNKRRKGHRPTRENYIKSQMGLAEYERAHGKEEAAVKRMATVQRNAQNYQ